MVPTNGPTQAPGPTNVVIITKVPEGANDLQLRAMAGVSSTILEMEYRPADVDGLGWALITFISPELAKAAKDRIHGRPLPMPPGHALALSSSGPGLEATLGEGLFGAMKQTDMRESLWKEARSAQGQVYYYHVKSRQTTWIQPPPEYETAVPPPPPGQRPGQAPAVGRASHLAPVAHAQAALQAAQASAAAAQAERDAQANLTGERTGSGPVGANLFVYHIPNSWNDSILRQHFEHFGSIVSCRVQTDTEGRTRGYGFVSYDAAAGAGAAIAGMHGFPVEGKWLKVQLKKGDEQQVGVPSSGPTTVPGFLGEVALIPPRPPVGLNAPPPPPGMPPAAVPPPPLPGFTPARPAPY